MIRRQVAYATIALLLFDSVVFARTELRPGWNLFTPQDDIKLGKQAQVTAEKQVKMVSNADLNRYVTNLGKRLASYAPNNDYPFNFHVIRDKSINAFALPGGPIYVNTGTIEAAENESQLAGVIAHEIGHVVLRHSTSAISKQYAAKVPLALLGGIVGGTALGNLVNTAASVGFSGYFLKYSRDHERQADLMGAQILYDSNDYDPREMARFFEKLEQQSKNQGQGIEFLSDHPNPGNRVQLVSQEVASLGPAHHAVDEDSEFPRMRQIAVDIDRTGASNSSSDSTHRASSEGTQSAPIPGPDLSRAMKSFNAKGYRVSYPNDWSISQQQSTALLSPPGGNTGNGVVLGAMISFFEPEEGHQNRVSLDDATRQLVEQIRHGNPGVRVTGNFQRVTIGGLAGDSVTMTGPSPLGGNEIDWLVAALRPDGTLWYVVFIASERDYGKWRTVFQQMMDSVQLAN